MTLWQRTELIPLPGMNYEQAVLLQSLIVDQMRAAVIEERNACAMEAMSSKTHDYNAGIAHAIKERPIP